MAHQKKPHFLVVKTHLGHQGVCQIREDSLPGVVHPREALIHPHSETTKAATHMIFLPHMGKIEIPDGIILVEANQKLSIADWYIPGYDDSLPLETISKLAYNVTPANPGRGPGQAQGSTTHPKIWIPAFAGMTFGGLSCSVGTQYHMDNPYVDANGLLPE
jgi:hypothetical protein